MILAVLIRSSSPYTLLRLGISLIHFYFVSLVFMGSEKYPYKGIIDHLANRGFSNGTNAWTDTDHTAYTVSTAGQQGFLQILPIYVDHILYPTMNKEGFVTEVCPLI
jgi:Zn-dependent M16 (insulinase) family peptidase